MVLPPGSLGAGAISNVFSALLEGGKAVNDERDSYGSAIREAMKESMKEPAGFRPLNRRKPPSILGNGYFLGFVLGTAISLIFIVLFIRFF